MKPLLLTLLIAHGYDGATTAMALGRGGREAVPVLSQSIPINLAQQASIAATEQWALRKLERNHPKLTKALAIVSISLHAAATVQNVRAYHQMRR